MFTERAILAQRHLLLPCELQARQEGAHNRRSSAYWGGRGLPAESQAPELPCRPSAPSVGPAGKLRLPREPRHSAATAGRRMSLPLSLLSAPPPRRKSLPGRQDWFCLRPCRAQPISTGEDVTAQRRARGNPGRRGPHYLQFLQLPQLAIGLLYSSAAAIASGFRHQQLRLRPHPVRRSSPPSPPSGQRHAADAGRLVRALLDLHPRPVPLADGRGQFLLRSETRQRLQAELCAPLGGRVGTRIWPNSLHTAGSTGTELSTRGCSSRIEGKPNFHHGAPNLHHAVYVNGISKNSHLGALSSEL